MRNINYQTSQKRLIYSLLLENSNKHLTADEMLNIFKQKNLNVSRATLYRNLDSLVEAKQIRKFEVSGSKACYQLINEKEQNHFHLVCSKCGKLIHLSCELVDEFIEHIEKEHNFEIDVGKVTFYGLCDDCKGKGGN